MYYDPSSRAITIALSYEPAWPARSHGTAGREHTVVDSPPDRRDFATYLRRYQDIDDRRLAGRLAAEDAAVEDGLSPFERLTCPVHRRWIYQCIASPLHVVAVTGHRWCRDCGTAASVAIDELTGGIAVTCPRCGRVPNSIATRQIIRACRASIATAQDNGGSAARGLPPAGVRHSQ